MKKNKPIDDLISIINGYELAIIKMLEKYRVSSFDIEKVQDYIANIERKTIKLYIEKKAFDEYYEKYRKDK